MVTSRESGETPRSRLYFEQMFVILNKEKGKGVKAMTDLLYEIFEELAREVAGLSDAQIEMLFAETIKTLKASMWPVMSLSTGEPAPV